MSVPSPDNESSQSSSGYEDGLGRRVLAFDRETGGMLERLVLRPELTAFEQALTGRIAVIATLEDERFARPRFVERHEDRLTVVSEFVAGRRLSDILECAAEHGIVAGLDASLGLLLELLPALARLHDAGLAHGALAPGRLMITPAAQIVLLDSIYAEPLERLQLTRKRLWAEFRLAFPSTAGLARFDKTADLAHASMVAATLAVGRALHDKDYPEGISVLRQEILEIASIRGSKSFAEAVDKFFASTLPIAGRRTTPSADEAAIDLRKLVRKELGINTCRTALLEFFQQAEAADFERSLADATARDQHAAQAQASAAEQVRRDADRRQWQDAETARPAQDRAAQARLEAARAEAERIERERDEEARLQAERERLNAERAAREHAEQVRLEAERIEREQLEAERFERERLEKARVEAERIERDRLEAERRERERLEAERLERERIEQARIEAERLERERIEAERRERERLEAERLERERIEQARIEAERLERERIEAERRERERLEAERRERERLAKERAEKARLEAERLERERLERERAEKARIEAERHERARLEAERIERERAERTRLEAEQRERERQEAERVAQEARQNAERLERERLEAARQAEQAKVEAERLEQQRTEAQRRERAEAQRIAETNRSDEAVDDTGSDPEPVREPPAPTRSGWLIPPNRAASFEPVPLPPAPPAPAPGARAYPIYVAPAEPAAAWSSEAPHLPEDREQLLALLSAPRPASPAPIKLASAPGSPQSIRLKTADERVHAPSRAQTRRDPVAVEASVADVHEPFRSFQEKREIPWKLIAAGVVLLAGGAAAYFGYAPSAAPVVNTVRKAMPQMSSPELPPVAANVGRLVISTQPAGAKVTLDGRPAGETPLTIDAVKPGRHVIAISGAEGAARRTVRVEAGQVLTLDIPLYSGFVAISIPFVVNVSEAGKALGTNESQIILGAGRHTLRLVNKELGFNATETVEITAGETTHLELDPKGEANINAAPWAEVWIDGEKAGETPLANVPIRLGVREIRFKNPQFPERKETVTITGKAPATISVDFIK